MIDRPPTREEVLAYNKWLGLSDPPPMVAPSPPTSSTKPRVGPLTLPPIYDHHDKWFGPHGTLVVTKDDGEYLPLSTFQLDKWIDPWYTVEVPGELLNAQRNLTNWKAP